MSVLFALIYSYQLLAQEDVLWLPRYDSPEIKKHIGKEVKTVRETDKYLNDFIEYLANNMKKIPNKLYLVNIQVLDEGEPQKFYGNAHCDYDKNEIKISRIKWIVSNEFERQQIVDHEIGHCVYGMIHAEDKSSIMQTQNFDYKTELIKKENRDYMFKNSRTDLIKILQYKIRNIKDEDQIKKIEAELNQ